MRYRRRYKYPKTTFQKVKRRVLLTSGLLVVLLFFLTKKYFGPPVRQFATNKAKLHVSVIINDAIKREVVPNIDMDEMMLFHHNEEGHITDVMIDVYQINNLITKMTEDMQEQLQNQLMTEQLNMPLGVLLSNPVFQTLGPEVAIEVRIVGNVLTDIITRTTPYGINNSLLEVLIKTEMNVLVVIPFQQEEITIVTYTPLVIKVIQGKVPQYYYSSSGGWGGPFIPPPREKEYPD